MISDQRRLIKFNKNCDQIFFNVQQTEDLNFAKEFTYLNFNITLNYVVLSLKLSIIVFFSSKFLLLSLCRTCCEIKVITSALGKSFKRCLIRLLRELEYWYVEVSTFIFIESNLNFIRRTFRR